MDNHRKRLVQEALLQLRRTRLTLDPAMLDRTRILIEKHAGMKAVALVPPVEHIAVDRRKNIATVLKFIETRSDDAGFLTRVQALFPSD